MRRRATAAGTNSSTVPPNEAISFTPLDETKLTCGLDITYTRLDLGRERAVELVHLELVLEVGDDAEALDEHGRLPAAGELDDELLEDVDLDVLDRRDGLAEQLDALLDREQRRLVLRIADDSDDDAVEDLAPRAGSRRRGRS